MELSQADFQYVRDLVYRTAGIAFEDRKLPFVQTRVLSRLRAIGAESPIEYCRHLRYSDADGSELQQLIEALTTNETYFFREYPQLECFANEVLPQLVAKKRAARERRLAVWSAACSTGDEPYTLAIILRACLDDFAWWQTDLLATDIDSNVLAVARRAAYSDRAVKDVPDAYLEQYFKVRGGQYCVDDEIMSMVQFEQVNLMDRQAMRRQRGFDVIFCRNVLIYFDDAARRRVLSSFYDSLNPGGYLFLGHSESVSRISAAYEMVSLGGQITYRRPLDKTSPTPSNAGAFACLTK